MSKLPGVMDETKSIMAIASASVPVEVLNLPSVSQEGEKLQVCWSANNTWLEGVVLAGRRCSPTGRGRLGRRRLSPYRATETVTLGFIV